MVSHSTPAPTHRTERRERGPRPVDHRVLVPVRCPLRDADREAIQQAMRRVQRRGRTRLIILHVNLLHRGRRMRAPRLRASVERVFGAVDDAVYVVRDGYLIEEEILAEVEAQRADAVVVGSVVSRWQRVLRRVGGAGPDIGAYLRRHTPANVDVVEVGRGTAVDIPVESA